MAWTPIAGTPPQYSTSTNVLAANYYLKFYKAGTTTAINMATDDTGGTTLDKCQLDDSGYPTTDGTNIFVPHIAEKCKPALYKNATDADNDTTASADWVPDNILQLATVPGTIEKYDTVTDAVASTSLAIGSIVIAVARATLGDGGGNLYQVVAASTGTHDNGRWIDAATYQLKGLFPRGEYWAEQWGCLGDNSTDDADNAQAGIDYLNSSYLGGTFGGGAGELKFQAKLYKLSGIIIKKGVSLIGKGQANSGLLMSTDGGRMIQTPAKASQSSADTVANSVIRGFTLGVHGSLTPSSSTVLLDTSGMSYCTFDDLYITVPSNTIGVDNTGNTLAGSGGPAHWGNRWYSTYFYVTGGIGCRWGDSDTATEQVTAQQFFGGAFKGTSGTGLHIRGGTGNSFHGTVFEGLASGSDTTIILGDSTGARVTRSNNFHGCYLEQMEIFHYSNSSRCRRWGGKETTVTETDNGTMNGRVDDEQLYRGWPRVYVSGRVTAPTTVNKSYNVGTVSNPLTGTYLIPFDGVTMPDTNYVVVANAESTDATCRISTKGTTSCQLYFFDDTGAATNVTSFSFMILDNDT